MQNVDFIKFMPATITWNVLLVEDNPADAHLIRMCADENPVIEIFHAPNAYQANQYLARNHPFEDVRIPDLVLLDLALPGFSGLDILQGLRENALLRQIPVIVLTSTYFKRNRERAMVLGATEYLVKPTDWGHWRIEIGRVFRQYLRRHDGFS